MSRTVKSLKNEQNIELKQSVEETPPTGVAPAAPVAAPEFKSFGWKAHNEITYRGVDFLLNSVIGITFAYWAQRTKAGLKYFGKPTESLGRMAIQPFTSDKASIEEGAKWGSRIASIIIGGTAIIPPMTFLENKKVKHAIVCGIDNMVYGKEAVENDPKFAELHNSINHEPKKDFVTGMLARFAVLIPMFAWTMTKKLNDPTIKYVYDPLARGTKHVAGSMGIKAPKMKSTIIDGQSNWDYLHQTISFDSFLTFVYSFLHEYSFKAFAAIRNPDKPDAPAPAKPEIIIQPAPVTEEKREVNFAERILREPQQASMAMGA